MKLIPVDGNRELARDSASGAILATDMSAYQKYIAAKKAKQQTEERIRTLEERILRLEQEVFKLPFKSTVM